jgi:RHS repeat-associated protein
MTSGGNALRTYTYDNAGNIITDLRPGAESFTYAYNNRNRMSSVTRNGVAYASYVYNAMEQLASRNTSAPGGPIGTVHYIYDTQGHLIAEADAATGATTREYLWLPSNDNQNNTLAEDMMAVNDNAPVDLPLAVVNVSATPVIYQVHTDHLGRPIRMTDAAKATIWQATWKPWGEVQSITGTVANNLRFPGQYFQLETGLAYNWHRTYDPVTGRYTQPDPLGFLDGPSIYAYSESSPFMRTDREGLKSAGIGIYGELTPGVGFGSGLGFQVDFPWFGDCTPFDLKLFGSLSGRVGLAASGGISAGLNTGSQECSCIVAETNVLDGQMEGDLSAYFGFFGVTKVFPVIRGADGSLDFDTSSTGANAELPRLKVRKEDGFSLGAGASAGLGGTGSISVWKLLTGR